MLITSEIELSVGSEAYFELGIYDLSVPVNFDQRHANFFIEKYFCVIWEFV